VLGRYIDLGNPVANHPLNLGLVAWYLPLPNNAGGGTLFDLKGRSHGTLVNGPTWSAGGRPGALRPCLSFDGSDDYVGITPATSAGWPDIGGAKTISMWTQFDSTLANSRILFSLVLDDSGGAGNSLDLYFSNSFSVRDINCRQWGGQLRLTAYPADYGVSAESWFHLTYTSGSGWTPQKFYFNGIPAASFSEATSTQTGAPGVCRIASFNAAFPDPYHNRPVDDVRVYNRALSAADAYALYWQSLRGHPDTMRKWSHRVWTFGQRGGGGGTTTPQSNSGSTTPSGTLQKTVNRSLAGSVTSSGTKTNSARKPLAASLTATGTKANSASKTISGSSTSSAALTRSFARPVSGSLTATGTETRSTSKSLAGSSTVTGSTSNIRAALQTLTGSLTATGATTRSTAKPLSGILTPTGTSAKSSSKSMSGSCTPTGTTSSIRAALQTLTSNLTATGSAIRSAAKTLTSSLTTTGIASKTTSRSLAGSTTPTGSLSINRALFQTLISTLAAIGTSARSVSKTLTCSSSISSAVSKLISKLFSGGSAPSGSASSTIPSPPEEASDRYLTSYARDDNYLTSYVQDDNYVTGIIGDGSMSYKKNFECNVGEKVTMDFFDTDSENRSGQTLVYRLRSVDYDGTILTTKTVGDGITFPSATPAGSTVRVLLDSEDTELPKGKYYYTLSRQDDEVVLAHGVLTVGRPRVFA